jgi:hypothetical protein
VSQRITCRRSRGAAGFFWELSAAIIHCRTTVLRRFSSDIAASSVVSLQSSVFSPSWVDD